MTNEQAKATFEGLPTVAELIRARLEWEPTNDPDLAASLGLDGEFRVHTVLLDGPCDYTIADITLTLRSGMSKWDILQKVALRLACDHMFDECRIAITQISDVEISVAIETTYITEEEIAQLF